MANEDRRGGTQRKHPVYRKVVDQIVIPDAGTTEVTGSITLNGIIGTATVNINDTTTAAATATLSIRDVDGAVLYSKAAIANDTITVLSNIDVLAAGDLTIGITPSADPGASTLTADIVLYTV